MKKIFRQATLALLIASLFSVSAGLGGVIYGASQSAFLSPVSGTMSGNISGEGSDAEASVPVIAPDHSTGETYILRETDGKIGVFTEGADTPALVLDVFVFTLPPKTAQMLRDGIECDAEGLSLLIDAFTS